MEKQAPQPEPRPAAPTTWLPDRLQLLGCTAGQLLEGGPDPSIVAFLRDEPFDSRALYDALVQRGWRERLGAIQKACPAFVPLLHAEEVRGGWTFPPPGLSLKELMKGWAGPPQDVIFDFEYSGSWKEFGILDELHAMKARVRRLRLLVGLGSEDDVDAITRFLDHCAGVQHDSMGIVVSDKVLGCDAERVVGKLVAALMRPPARLRELGLRLVHCELSHIAGAAVMLRQVLPELEILHVESSGTDLATHLPLVLEAGRSLQVLRLRERKVPSGSIKGEQSWEDLVKSLVGLPALKSLLLQAHGIPTFPVTTQLEIAFERLGLLDCYLCTHAGYAVHRAINACLQRNARRSRKDTTLAMEAMLLARKMFRVHELPSADVDRLLGGYIVDVAHKSAPARNAVMRLVSPAVVKELQADRGALRALFDACEHYELYEVVAGCILQQICARDGRPVGVHEFKALKRHLDQCGLALEPAGVFAALMEARQAVMQAPGADRAEAPHGAPAQACGCVLFTQQWLQSLDVSSGKTRQEEIFGRHCSAVSSLLDQTGAYLLTLRVAQAQVDRIVADLRYVLHETVLRPWYERSYCQAMGIAFPLVDHARPEAAAPRH